MELPRISIDSITRWFIDGIFTGYHAVCSRTLTEANVLNGRQRVASGEFTIAQGATQYIGFRTGAEPVIIKSRLLQLAGGTKVAYSAKAGVSFTENHANTITICNPNTRYKVPVGATAFHTVTPGADVPGVTDKYLNDYPVYASGITAASRLGSDAQGLEYVLKENTSHVFAIKNTGTGAATVHWWLTFYEGAPDLPVS